MLTTVLLLAILVCSFAAAAFAWIAWRSLDLLEHKISNRVDTKVAQIRAILLGKLLEEGRSLEDIREQYPHIAPMWER